MAQKQESILADREARVGRGSAGSFAALLALAGPRPMGEKELEERLGIDEAERVKLVDRLHRGYLVDLVSHLDGGSVRVTLKLTEEGERELVHHLERMCELPERAT